MISSGVENKNRQAAEDEIRCQLEAILGGRAMFGISDTPEDAIAKVNRVSVEEVVKAARRTVLDTVYYMEGSLNGGAEEEEV